jgi:hypothetical protein
VDPRKGTLTREGAQEFGRVETFDDPALPGDQFVVVLRDNVVNVYKTKGGPGGVLKCVEWVYGRVKSGSADDNGAVVSEPDVVIGYGSAVTEGGADEVVGAGEFHGSSS